MDGSPQFPLILTRTVNITQTPHLRLPPCFQRLAPDLPVSIELRLANGLHSPRGIPLGPQEPGHRRILRPPRSPGQGGLQQGESLFRLNEMK